VSKVTTRWLRCTLGGNKMTEVCTRGISYSLGEYVVAEMSQGFLRYNRGGCSRLLRCALRDYEIAKVCPRWVQGV
jgi:hypothetical protein